MEDSSSKTLSEWFGLKGKTVLLWGCTGQIGTAVSKCFAELGADVIGTSTNEDRLEGVRASLNGLPGKFIKGQICDITNPESLKNAVSELSGFLKDRPVDISIVIAGGTVKGVSPKDKFEDFDDAVFEKTVRLNYTAPVSVLRQTIPLMEKAEFPTIGAVCSMSYTGHLSRVFGYRGSKIALEDTLSFLTQELMKKGKNWTVPWLETRFCLSRTKRRNIG